MTGPAPRFRPGSPGDGVMRVLRAFRREHGHRPGLVWDPTRPRNYNCSCPLLRGKRHGGAYVPAAQQRYTP